MNTQAQHASAEEQQNSTSRVAIASFVGTAIEFYDFYIYGLASAMVLGELFFPSKDPALEVMASFLTFGIAFVARPIGAALFGHFGDKIGRKTTLIASLLIMGISTTLIGVLPTYHQAGILAPLLLCILRFGQGLGLGGEWGGAALLATENAPKGRRALFAMFPQIGPPIGFIIASGVFILLHKMTTPEQMMAWGWRIPFLLSVVLIGLGLYVRMSIVESSAFRKMVARQSQAQLPFSDVIKHHGRKLLLGSFAAMSCFTLFFLTTVFSLQYATTKHPWMEHAFYGKIEYLLALMLAIVFMALGSPVGAWLSEKLGRRVTFIATNLLTVIVGFFWGSIMNTDTLALSTVYLSVCLFVMGMLWTPLAAYLPEIFPTNVRYSGASLAFSLGGILGGSLTPFAATALIREFGEKGIHYVGYMLVVSALLSMISVWLLPETRHVDLEH